MTTITAEEMVKRPRDLFDAALQGPVFISHHKRERFVVMSIDHYNRLAQPSPNPQRVVDVTNISSQDAAEFLAAAAPLLTEADRGDA
jgi:PHD/YefM family antitoxin component YafN of YafNO toxin-antitoxin module